MLSYQHAYHAGNAADVHKHALLAAMLAYLVQKDKPLIYMETHAGRALYDLEAPEARKTGEAASGILRREAHLAPDHPYRQALAACRGGHGAAAYPGSPWIARHWLRSGDTLVLCERHPREAAALRRALPGATILEEDGPAAILSRLPPTPRRGLLLIDPSYEVKTEWTAVPDLAAKAHRRWNVGTIALWYPVLASQAHRPLVQALDRMGWPRHEVRFAPARPGHGMVGSGFATVNAPWGWDDATQALAAAFPRPDT